jgi:hypothetical protein
MVLVAGVGSLFAVGGAALGAAVPVSPARSPSTRRRSRARRNSRSFSRRRGWPEATAPGRSCSWRVPQWGARRAAGRQVREPHAFAEHRRARGLIAPMPAHADVRRRRYAAGAPAAVPPPRDGRRRRARQRRAAGAVRGRGARPARASRCERAAVPSAVREPLVVVRVPAVDRAAARCRVRGAFLAALSSAASTPREPPIGACSTMCDATSPRGTSPSTSSTSRRSLSRSASRQPEHLPSCIRTVDRPGTRRTPRHTHAEKDRPGAAPSSRARSIARRRADERVAMADHSHLCHLSLCRSATLGAAPAERRAASSSSSHPPPSAL